MLLYENFYCLTWCWFMVLGGRYFLWVGFFFWCVMEAFAFPAAFHSFLGYWITGTFGANPLPSPLLKLLF